MNHEIDGDKSRVRLSLSQLWAVIAAVAAAGFFVAGGIWSIRGDLSLYREQAAMQFQTANATLRELKDERSEWNQWRSAVNEKNTIQDGRLRQLESWPRNPSNAYDHTRQ